MQPNCSAQVRSMLAKSAAYLQSIMLYLAEPEIVKIKDDGKSQIFLNFQRQRSHTYSYRLSLLSTPNSSGRTLPLSIQHVPQKTNINFKTKNLQSRSDPIRKKNDS